MTKNIRLLGILFMAVWAATVDAHYYNNVRVNDTPVRCLAQTTGKMRMIVVSDKGDKHNARWAYDIIDDGTGRLWVAAYSGGIFIVSKEKLLAGGDFVVADRHLDCRNGGLSFLWVRQLAKDEPRRGAAESHYQATLQHFGCGGKLQAVCLPTLSGKNLC